MTEATFERLAPAGDPLDAESYLAFLEAVRAPADRPYTIANFVMSADGQASFEGRSAPLSDPGDRALFHALRARADAVLAGTRTLAAERYRPVKRGAACTITRSGELPLEIPLFQEPGEVVVFSGVPIDPDVPATVHLEPLTDLRPAMATLRTKYAVKLLLCEGGPTLFGALIQAGLIDELFLTLAPKLAGGGALGIAPSLPATMLQPVGFRSALVREGTLFLRYVMT